MDISFERVSCLRSRRKTAQRYKSIENDDGFAGMCYAIIKTVLYDE